MPPDAPADVAAPDRVDRRLIDHLHSGLPLSDRPFAEVGRALGLSETEVIERLRRMLALGTLTRLGPLFQIERAGGVFLLAALEVPDPDFDRVAALVNSLPEVAHNYRREHRLNMWFVIAAESPDAAQRAIDRVTGLSGLPVLVFPKEREYFVGLRLPAETQGGHGAE
jgi:DNA-binding Lrp family transcriptional regulator